MSTSSGVVTLVPTLNAQFNNLPTHHDPTKQGQHEDTQTQEQTRADTRSYQYLCPCLTNRHLPATPPLLRLLSPVQDKLLFTPGPLTTSFPVKQVRQERGRMCTYTVPPCTWPPISHIDLTLHYWSRSSSYFFSFSRP